MMLLPCRTFSTGPVPFGGSPYLLVNVQAVGCVNGPTTMGRQGKRRGLLEGWQQLGGSGRIVGGITQHINIDAY